MVSSHFNSDINCGTQPKVNVLYYIMINLQVVKLELSATKVHL